MIHLCLYVYYTWGTPPEFRNSLCMHVLVNRVDEMKGLQSKNNYEVTFPRTYDEDQTFMLNNEYS